MDLLPIEPGKVQITSDQLDGICCNSCESEYFKQVIMLKRISKLYTGTTKDKIVTIPVFICDACGESIDMEKLA